MYYFGRKILSQFSQPVDGSGDQSQTKTLKLYVDKGCGNTNDLKKDKSTQTDAI